MNTKLYSDWEEAGLRLNVKWGGLIFISVFLSACTTAYKNKNDPYVIVDAVVRAEGVKQPTWVALFYRYPVIHVSTAKPLAPVRPGNYRIAHIDFTENVKSDEGTTYFKMNDIKPIRLRPRVIYFIGLIELHQKNFHPGEYYWNIVIDENLMCRACDLMPESLSHYTMRFPYSENPEKDYKLRCEVP